MLKRRVIATLIVRDGIVVQSIGFRSYLPIGSPQIAVEFLNSWGIDEIVIIDITASRNHAAKHYGFIQDVSVSCRVPLMVGGGVDSVADIRSLLTFGADKVLVNSVCLSSPTFITQAAQVFGQQCIVVGIDVVGSQLSKYRVYNAAQGRVTDHEPVAWARQVESLGAGEILLTSVDRDGSKRGYELDLVEVVAGAVEIPVIASGGAGNAHHMAEVFRKTSASAVSASNFFNFSEHSVILTKAALKRGGIDIRLNSHAHYTEHPVREDGRLRKQDEGVLEDLLFVKIDKEVI